MAKLRKSKKKGLELIRQMQYEIDEYNRFIEHLFLLLKKDPNRQCFVSDIPQAPLMNEICIEIDKLLVQFGKKANSQLQTENQKF